MHDDGVVTEEMIERYRVLALREGSRLAILRQAAQAADRHDGSADLSHVLDVARTIGENLTPDAIVVTKSTVPVGTAPKVREEIESRTDVPFHVVSNPEFLKEGAAVEDFMKPDRIVLGVESDEVKPRLEELYEPFVRTGNPVIFMDVASAEMVKYAANTMLATKISFINEMANLCEAVGGDVQAVLLAGFDGLVGRDSQIEAWIGRGTREPTVAVGFDTAPVTGVVLYPHPAQVRRYHQ